jgi:hypothetical protein
MYAPSGLCALLKGRDAAVANGPARRATRERDESARDPLTRVLPAGWRRLLTWCDIAICASRPGACQPLTMPLSQLSHSDARPCLEAALEENEHRAAHMDNWVPAGRRRLLARPCAWLAPVRGL